MIRKLILAAFLALAAIGTANAANRFGVCSTTCTWDGSSTAMWSTTSGGGTGASVPGSADAVIFDGATCVGGTTCTITVNTTVTVTSITSGACTASTTGCILDFSANNNNVTLTSVFSSTGTGTRTINMGSGTFTFTGTQTIDFTTMTNMTLSSASVVVTLTNTTTSTRSITFGAAASVGTINIGANTSAGAAIITTASGTTLTIGTLNVTAPNFLVFSGPTRTYAITNGFNFTGSSGSPISVIGSVASGNPTLTSANAMGGTWLAVWNAAFAGGGNFTATNSFDLGNVTISGGGSKSITVPSGSAAPPGFIGGGL